MSKNHVLAELESLIANKTAKIAAAKTASVGDNANDGLEKGKTGERAAENAAASATSTPGSGSPDGGAKPNPVNASVTNGPSTQTVSASATDGSAGAKGELGTPEVSPGSNAKIASDLRAEAAKMEKYEEAKVASVTGIARFLVNTVRGDSELAKIAADSDDMQVADQAGSSLMDQIQSGQLSEEDALKILQDAVASGAISQEDVNKAMAEMQAQQGGAGAPPSAPPEAAAAAAPPMPQGGEQMVNDPALEAKMASVDVGPNHPLYGQKLEVLYSDAVRAGADFLTKCANELGMLPSDQGKEADKPQELTEEEKKALEAAKKELGLTDAQTTELMDAPAPEMKTASDRFKAELLLRAAFKK